MRLRLAYLLIAVLAFTAAGLMWSHRAGVGLLDRIDRLTLDAQMQWRGKLQPAAPITLLLVDDQSLQGLASTDRRWMVQALDKLGEARLVVFDMLLIEPGDAQSDQALARAMARSGRVLIPFALPAEAGPDAEP